MPHRAKTLAASLAPQVKAPVHPGSLDDWKTVAGDAALVVNSTSAGMGGNPPLDIDLAALPKDAAVCDIVYNPLETKLLKDAAARGHKTIDGLGMLMHQAVPSFEAFFGVKPAVTPALRAALVKVLRASGNKPAFCHRPDRLDRHGQKRDRQAVRRRRHSGVRRRCRDP